MVFHEYTGHLFLGSRKLFFNYIDMKAFNLALNPYIIPLQAFSYSFNVRYTCRFFPGWVVNSPFLMATRRSFLSSVISAPGYKCPPWTSGVRIPLKGCGMCLRFCLFTSCMTPTLIGWIWPKFRGGGWNNLFIASGWWGFGSMSKNTGCIKFKFMSIILQFISLAIIMNAC